VDANGLINWNSNTRSPTRMPKSIDPLLELARIIGYERPSEVNARGRPTAPESMSSISGELMRATRICFRWRFSRMNSSSIEADELWMSMLADAGFDLGAASSSSGYGSGWSRRSCRFENPAGDVPSSIALISFRPEGVRLMPCSRRIEYEFRPSIQALIRLPDEFWSGR